MKNEAIAAALVDLADVMELTGESPFRVRALRAAARTIESASAPVAEALAKGEHLRGVGEGVVRRVEELGRTGRLAELDALRAKLPPGLLDLTSLAGVGIKTARQLWEERGISTLDALEQAARRGELRTLDRFSEKREEKLLAAVEAWRKRAAAPKRWPMATALELAESICERLRARPDVARCECAGSLRRRRDTVGDVDVLVCADERDAPAIASAFASLPEVVEVLAKGDTKSSVVLAGGLQADLRVVGREAFGAALVYFTGSKDHNVAVRTLALKKGLKVSEYGVFDRAGARTAGATEEEVYAAVGLAWVPPELREDRGEIEAAQRGELPELVELADLRGDLHMHTTESDGRSTLEEMVAAARRERREYVAITDHSRALPIARGLDPARLAAHVRRIRALDEAQGGAIGVLAGLEADILADGTVDMAEHTRGLDWVVGSVHSKLDMPRAEMTARVVKAIESGCIDVLGHPTGRMLGVREESAIDLDAVLRALARARAAIELNSSPLRLDVTERWARAARDLGVPVVLSTDAHGTRELAFLRYGVGIARRAWLEKEHVLTTRTRKQLAAWRRERRA